MWYLAEAPALSAVACDSVPALTLLSGSTPPEKKPFEPLRRREPGHSIDHLLLTPLELIHNTRDSVRKAREVHLINKAMTLELLGINRRDEQN